MKNWKKFTLSQICEIQIGKTPDRNNDSYWGKGFNWVSIRDLKTDTVSKTKEQITESAIRDCNCKLIPAGTLLMSFKLSIGKLAFNDKPIYTNEAIAALLVKDEDLVYKRFLYYALQVADLLKDTDRAVMGATLNKRKLAEIEIPLPPLAEQKRIAEVLDKADRLRQKDRQLLQKYDQLLQSVFLDMFGDPVKNEKGWEELYFSEVGKLDRGKSKHRPRNAPELLGGPYPLIQTGDVANSNRYIRFFNHTYSEIGLKQSKLWPAGTLCITIAANIAKTGILTFDACFPDSVVGFKPNEKVEAVYVQTWLSFLQKTLEENAPESAQKNINLEILRTLKIPVPPITIQQKYKEVLGKIESIKKMHNKNLENSEKLFQSLLQNAFKGELALKETEPAAALDLA